MTAFFRAGIISNSVSIPERKYKTNKRKTSQTRYKQTKRRKASAYWTFIVAAIETSGRILKYDKRKKI